MRLCSSESSQDKGGAEGENDLTAGSQSGVHGSRFYKTSASLMIMAKGEGLEFLFLGHFTLSRVNLPYSACE